MKRSGSGKRFGVSICGGKYQQQRIARPDGLITEDDVFKGLAPDELVRTHQAHQLLDRRRPLGRVPRQLSADFRKTEQHRGTVSDQARRVLVSGDEQEHDVRKQLLLGKPVRRLAGEQPADHIVCAVRRAMVAQHSIDEFVQPGSR